MAARMSVARVREAAAPRFATGDIVELRSGGPGMTVIGIEEQDGEYLYRCVWFSSRVHRALVIPESALVASS